MIQFPYKQDIINFIDPIVESRTFQVVSAVVVEMVKIIAAKAFLELLTKKFLSDVNSKVTPRIYNVVILAPVLEEIFFRGMLLPGIHLAQKGWNYLRGNELTDEELETQQVFRVHLSATIFGAVHLFNPHETVSAAIHQFGWTYFLGISWGYMSEKYQTISVCILSHGFNNALVIGRDALPIHYAPLFNLAALANQIAAYELAVTALDEKLYAGFLQTAEYCAALPGRFMGWDVQEASPLDAAVV